MHVIRVGVCVCVWWCGGGGGCLFVCVFLCMGNL